MRVLFLITLLSAVIFQSDVNAQAVVTPKLYSHKVEVEDILQTKNYTYLQVKEHVKEIDSLYWLALPKYEFSLKGIYYYEQGLQMGEFQSKELNRTFPEVIFIGGLSTSREFSDKTIVPPPALPEDTSAIVAPEIHTVVVKEVLQTSGYTYLKVRDGDKEVWLAITKLTASVGQTYTFDDAAPMSNFTSKELKRTFPEILFVAKLKLKDGSDDQETAMPKSHGLTSSEISEGKNSEPKKEIKIDVKKGAVTIAKILEKKESFEGKKVKIKGEVTRFSNDILSKNWIHIEDGTSYSGKYDLTITTDQVVKVGDVITVEGIISTERDFGSGYFFDVMMEDAKVHVE